MIKKITALFTILAIASLPALSSAATCTRADFTGTWRLYTVFDSVGRCTLIMPGAGTTISTSSTCYLPGVVNSTPLRGALTISTDCHVTGTATVGIQKLNIDAWISKGKDSLSGMAWKSGDSYNGDIFSGIKQ
ncbi:MAG: hypothetical protein ACXWTW_09495 [Methylobacter sp.]